MDNNTVKKIPTDVDVKRKAVKLVISHLKKKFSNDFVGSDHFKDWLENMEALLCKPEFDLKQYLQMRKNLNDVIERTVDEEIRFKMRDSWYSLGKALDKRVKQS